jgi:hypothetical protein
MKVPEDQQNKWEKLLPVDDHYSMFKIIWGIQQKG